MFAASCSQIKIEEIQGRWSYQPTNSLAPEFTEFTIKNDTVELIADDGFKEMGIVSIESDLLNFTLIRDSLHFIYEIDNLEIDTLNVEDSVKFLRNSYLGNANFEDYELINISTNNLLSTKTNYYKTIHFYKSAKDELRIRCGDRMTELRDIPLFLMEHHQNKPTEIVVLIGKGIVLRDLKQLHNVLSMSGHFKIYLGTKRYGNVDTEILRDDIEFWWDDVEEFRISQNSMTPPLPPPMPPLVYKNKLTFLASSGQEIAVKSQIDILQLKSINYLGKYVIEMNENLSIEQYIQVKQIVQEIKKTNKNIRTSIN